MSHTFYMLDEVAGLAVRNGKRKKNSRKATKQEVSLCVESRV